MESIDEKDELRFRKWVQIIETSLKAAAAGL